MLEWTLLWAVLKYRQRKCVKNCTIRTKLLNMASGMRLFWNFRNCFNPINFLFKLYIYVVSLCTHYYPLNGLVECCDEIYVTNQLTGARKYSCIDQTLLLRLFAIVATTLKVLKLKPLLPCLKERKHVNTFSFHCFYGEDFIRWEKLSSD